jgi:nucleoside-diphosphate-sugar epimerase
MNIALTGVSGFVGSHLVRLLYERGHFITGLVRHTSRTDHVRPFVSRFVEGEQDDAEACAELLEGNDCVIHNAVDWAPLREKDGFERHLHSNLLGSLRLLRCSAPRQFIFVSSVAVHHDIRPSWEGIIDEEHPLRPNGFYGAYKASVEAFLWAEHLLPGPAGAPVNRNTSAVRPAGVYGIDPDLPSSLGYDLVKKVLAGETIVKHGGGKWVSVEDVALAVAAIVGNPGASGQVYNLVDCYARWADWAKMAAEEAGVRVQVDFSSPPEPRNEFSAAAARTLGVTLDRGPAGIREHLRQLIALVRRNEEK